MKSRTLLYSALAVLSALACPFARADNMASLAITPATGEVTLTPRWTIGGHLAGFHVMAQDLSLGGGANQFYSIKGTAIPAGGDIAAFTRYIAGSGAATNHADLGSKLTPDAYSALTSADPDVGFGPVNFYFIHHKSSGDYFTTIVPSSGTASAVTDLKPMSGPGGPATLGASGYFGLTFAAANLGSGLNRFYYFRTDAVTGFTKFGTLDPALLATSADLFDLGLGGHQALAFTGTDVGYGTDQMYYLRLDPITGFTILGTLHPVTGRVADIANLGSVYATLTFAPGDVGFGPGQFYTAGAVNPTWQSVSFAAIADRLVSAGSFAVAPSASSGLPIVLTVVSGSTGAATISAPVAGVFTVTPTSPGRITLQATQAGQTAPVAFESNMLRQSFTATGAPVITNSLLTTTAAVGTSFTFTITAAGTPTSYTASPLPAGLTLVASTGVISGTPTTVGTTSVLLGAVNGLGTGNATLTITVGATPATPTVTTQPANQAATAGGTVTFTADAAGTPPFTYQWYHDGVLLPGATSATLTLTQLTPADAGTYTATITNAGGTVTTTAGILTLGASRIVNFSARAVSGPGDQTLIMGFVVAGPGKHLLVRGVGPTLASYGVANALADPMLTLYGATGAVATNDNWQISSAGQDQGIAIAATAVEVGAFPLPNGSKDSALLFTVGDGAHTTSMLRPNGAAGVALTEIYDTDTVLGTRLVNVSARMSVAAADGTLIAGLVIAGDAPKTVLIRGVGPTLAAYGVTGVLADPRITVFADGTEVAANDDWEVGANTPATIMLVSAQVGAFALPAGSKDAALLVTLRPGSYSVHVTGVAATTGVALVEVYDTQ